MLILYKCFKGIFSYTSLRRDRCPFLFWHAKIFSARLDDGVIRADGLGGPKTAFFIEKPDTP
ncbi:hypothetical protein ORN12_18760 [Pantoea vagans]|uniref:hypothetical protein n=1 Tax=Pantoea vagans TaxID=470934 RepID=UPI0022557F31|nr:hypothetical protein [Pantoea vagans]MCX3311003.1 hypothetical protein [Pantoea vagans]